MAGLVMDAATKFVGRAIGRRVKRAYEERVVPAVAAKQEAMLREQIAIAERHPDLRACLTDQVIFLAGSSRVLPMSSLSRGLTLELGRRHGGPATERLNPVLTTFNSGYLPGAAARG